MLKHFLALQGLLIYALMGMAQPSNPDAILNNIEIQTGCIGDVPAYNITYTVLNIGQDTITDYCVEIWNEDYYQCFDGALFGAYEIPPGEGQLFQTPFWEASGPGNLFVMSVDNVNDEIVTGNNNTTVFLPEWPECPIIQSDTITITEYENVYIYDTITQYVNLYDTLYIDNYIYDTTYIEVPVFEYIYVTDTITEYILQEIWIDCETGLECTDEPPGIECLDEITFYAANTFTPNEDGINEVWKLIYDLNCWVDVEFWIFNRWGSLIYHDYGDSFEDYPYWDGANVADGVYIYTFKGRKRGASEVIKKSGHITVFR
jgi:gliding motility-associated-like protein